MSLSEGIDAHLERVRVEFGRLTPSEALDRVRGGAYLVDTRPQFQRELGGEIPFAVVVERNHLEWRLDPSSVARIPEAVDHDVSWIIICDEGFSSSLAAASLLRLGLHHATDVLGGFQRWRSEGLPVVHPETISGPRLWPDVATPSRLGPGLNGHLESVG